MHLLVICTHTICNNEPKFVFFVRHIHFVVTVRPAVDGGAIFVTIVNNIPSTMYAAAAAPDASTFTHSQAK